MTEQTEASARPSPSRFCPNCNEFTITVALDLRWCMHCGTLTYPPGYQWGGCAGESSTPFLVNSIKDHESDFGQRLNYVRERVGLPLVVEKGGVQ